MTLDDGVTTIELPDSLEWTDEHDWSDVKQEITPTVGGGIVIEEALVVAGQPITLDSGEDVWIKKGVLDALVALMNTIDKTYTLTMQDEVTTHTVAFKRTDGSPISAKPVFRKNIPDANADYTVVIRLIKV